MLKRTIIIGIDYIIPTQTNINYIINNLLPLED